MAAGCTPAAVGSSGCDTQAGYADARVTHFHHQANQPAGCGFEPLEWDTVESSKEPLENRVWYNYPGQCAAFLPGTYDLPSKIGRVLDDGSTQLTSLLYNALGNPTSVTDPVGRQTTFNYAANNIDVASIEQTTAGGTPTIAQFTWNSRHRPLSWTDVAGQAWNYSYNAAGQLLSVTDPLGETTRYSYDAAGDLVSVVNADGETAASFTYDGFDRVASYTDAGGWTVDFAYDAADRLTQATYPDGTSDQYAYNLLDLGSYTNRAGRVWSYAHDADRRLVSVADPNGNKTQLAWYENDRLKSLTDANGHTTSWTIDDESRPTAKQFADGTTIGYTWDTTISLLAALTDARGETRSYSYALDNRLASITYGNTLNPTPNVSLRWDPYFPLLVAMRDGGGASTYVYYAVGFTGALHVKTETGPYASIGYAYDALGRLASRTVGGAATETFGYDAIGRQTSHGTALGTFSYGYLGETGQPTSRQLVGGGGIATTWAYLGNLGDRRLAAITNTPGRSFGYTTTPTDLVTAIAETPNPPGQNWSFSYDAANQLTGGQSTSEGTYPYTLDPVGNITAFGAIAAAYNAVNELASLGGVAYAWDADGNLTSDTARSYTWDAENRLVGIGYTAQPGTSTAFAYDGLGRRIGDAETASGNTIATNYVWCGGRLCQSQNANGAIGREYYPEGEYLPASGTAIYYGPDQLGSVRDAYVTSPVVSMVQAYDYDPLGNPIAVPPSGPYADFHYAGLFWHAGAGLALSRTRPYQPAIGRWLACDPLGEGTDPAFSLYRYADGNPISYIDPSGQQWIPGAILGALAGGGLDLAAQLVGNGGNLGCISWGQVAGAAGAGRFSVLGRSFLRESERPRRQQPKIP